MLSTVPPAVSTQARTLLKACLNCSANLSLTSRSLASHPTWPATNNARPAGISIALA
jgi:hypothetical protein